MNVASTLPWLVCLLALGLIAWLVRALRSDLRAFASSLRGLPASQAAPPHADSEPAPSSAIAPSSRELVRLLLAQHWARSAISYPQGDPSKPLVMGLAIVALLARSDDELGELLRHQAKAHDALELPPASAGEVWATSKPSASTLRAALQELTEARQGAGLAIEEPDAWDWGHLAARAEDFLSDSLAETERQTSANAQPANDFC